jgi:PAS domain S-box-containing protein
MTEQEFMLSDAVSKAVLVSAPEGILVVNRAGKIVLMNGKTAELLQYRPDEMLGMDYEAVLPEFFRHEHERQIAGCAEGREAKPSRGELELVARRKDGKEVLIEMSVCSVNEEDGPLVCCVLREAPSGRQTEQERNRAARHFRLMVENSHDVLCIRGADGKVRYASPSIERVMGYKQEEMIGGTGLELVHPEDRATVENAMHEFWKRPGGRGSIQYRARHANGSWVSLEVVAYNLLDDPEVQGVVLNGRDISDRKREEAVMEEAILGLQEAAALGNPLSGMLLVCASCKNIKNEVGIWERIEQFIRSRTQVEFSHGICPECAKYWYGDYLKK